MSALVVRIIKFIPAFGESRFDLVRSNSNTAAWHKPN